MLSNYLLILIATLGLSFPGLSHGLRGHKGMFPGSLTKNTGRSRFGAPASRRETPIDRRQAPVQTACGSGGQVTTKAPKVNIFAGLTDDEAAAVTSFLHDQKSLNLTAASSATR